jgi:drug/metabolite transporter (DMT)-like permease
VIAQLAMVGGAFFYAVSGVYGRRFQGRPPAVIAASVLLVGAFLLLPLASLIDRPWTLPTPSMTAMASAVGLALFSTAFAFLVYFRVLARVGAVNLQLVSFLIPVSAIGMSVSFLGETLSWRQIAGMIVIFMGLAVMDGRLQRLFRRNAE